MFTRRLIAAELYLLLMTFAGCRLDEVSVDTAGVISDHALVVLSLPIHVDQAVNAERLVRGWRRVDRNELRRVLEDSPLSRPDAAGVSVDELFATYDNVLRNVAYSLAPQHRLRLRPGRRRLSHREAQLPSFRALLHTPSTMVVAESTPYVSDFSCTGPRKKITGSSDYSSIYSSTGGQPLNYGVHYRQC